MCFLCFVVKIYSAMRTANEQRVFVVHQAQEMDTREERLAHRPADISHTFSRHRPQEHDERTVIISHSLLNFVALGSIYSTKTMGQTL